MEKKRKLPVLTIVTAGSPEFQRYLIADSQNRLWTGHGFAERGLIYGDFNDAAIDTQRILRSQFDGIEPQVFVAPLVIEVFSDNPIPVAFIARHLSRSARLHLDVPQHGHGPNGSLVLPVIDWSRIEERPNA